MSRRRMVTGLGGGLLLGLLGSDVTAGKKKKAKSCPPCKRRKQGTCKGTQPDGTACAGGTCQRGRCLAAQAGLPATQPSLRLVYQCPGPSEGPLFGSGSDRYAHTFIPGQSGALRQIAFGIMKEGTAGDYVVQLLQVSGDNPGASAGAVLATVTISDAGIPDGPSTLVARFSGPALVVGTEYAAAITRPASTRLALQSRGGPACTGKGFGASSTSAFNLLAYDPIVEVLID